MFQEWAPLDYILSRVPPIGKYGKDQDVTSVATTHGFIAIGTNCGSVFWYNRCEDTLQRLDCGTRVSCITCLDLVETQDFMLSVGSSDGELVIFRIPKPIMSQDGISYPGTVQNVQQFSIQNVHDFSISCLKWSINGQKLFSGDKSGRIVASVIDFFSNSVSSRVISSENSEIVSLDYQMGILLVSTVTSTFAFSFKSDTATQKIQIGQEGRQAGHYGSAFLQTGIGLSGLRFLVVRPDNKFWISNLKGDIEKTINLKDSVQNCHSEIPIINPSNIINDNSLPIAQIKVLSESRQEVIVWNFSSLHIVSLINDQVLTSCHALRNIHAIFKSEDFEEFFVLETGRSVIRLSSKADTMLPVKDWRYGDTISQGADTALQASLETLGSKITNSIPKLGALKNFSSNLSLDSIKNSIMKVGSFETRSPSPDVIDAVIGVDYNKPPVVSDVRAALDRQGNKLMNKEFLDKMDKIGQSEYDEEVVQHKKSPRLSKSNRRASDHDINIVTIGGSSETELSEQLKLSEKENENNLTSMEKEETLLKLLGVSNLQDKSNNLSSNENENIAQEPPNDEGNPQQSDSIDSVTNIGYGPPSDSSVSMPSNSLVNTSGLSSGPVLSNEHKLQGITEENEVDTENNSNVFNKIASPIEGSVLEQDMECNAENMADDWLKFELPGPSGTLCENNNHVFFCDDRENVFYSEVSQSKLVWKKAKFHASTVSTSTDGTVVWRIHQDTAWCLINPDPSRPGDSGKWHKLCQNVASIWVGSSSAWMVKLDGGLVCHPQISSSSPYSLNTRQIYIEELTENFLNSVKEVKGYLIGKTFPNNKLIMCGVDQLTSESTWTPLDTPCDSINVFTIGPKNEIWICGSKGEVYVSCDWFKSTNQHIPATWSSIHSFMTADGNSHQGGVIRPFECGPVLTAGVTRLWLAPVMSTCVQTHLWPTAGYQYSRLPVSSHLSHKNIRNIYGGSRDAYAGSLLINTYDGLLLEASPNTGTVSLISLPHKETIQDISVVPGFIWMLSVSGHLYIKQDQSDWSALSLTQLHEERLVSVSIASSGQVWAVGHTGQVYMTLMPGSLGPPGSPVTPAWLPIDMDGVTGDGAKIVDICCSSTGHMVWARDNNNGVYVREGVFPEDHPVGTGWIHVTGVLVVSLAMSRSTVWALSASGQIYRRRGVAETNWVGDTWTRVCGQATCLTVGQCDTVWIVDNAGHVKQLIIVEIGGEPDVEARAGDEEDGWTMLH